MENAFGVGAFLFNPTVQLVDPVFAEPKNPTTVGEVPQFLP